MILKYLYRTVYILLWGLVLTSCLNSSQNDLELSKDAQIYSFTVTSSKDTSNILSGTVFSIDQIGGRIFNRDSLPYLFHVDSLKLSVSGKSGYGFSNLLVKLVNNDSSYNWNGTDSIALKRLKSIETTAPDLKTKMLYEISINIHQQDPYIMNWTRVAQNYIPFSVENQKTIRHNGQFFTFYNSGNDLRASVSSVSNISWTPVTLVGLPSSVRVNSILSVENGDETAVYAQDLDDSVYRSEDGLIWNKIETSYLVKAIFGVMPTTSGEFTLLLAVDDGGTLKFATTTNFSTFNIKDNLPEGMPLNGFSAVSIENPKVFAAKYIILYGGKNKNGGINDKLWIIQEQSGRIVYISPKPAIEMISAELFLYDEKVYLLAFDGVENKLYYSINYGLDWVSGGESQSVPEELSGRKKSSVLTDSNNFIWIFGGESPNQTQIVDAWRGRLNKLAK